MLYNKLPTDTEGLLVDSGGRTRRIAWGVREDSAFGYSMQLHYFNEDRQEWVALLGDDASNGRTSILTERAHIVTMLNRWLVKANGVLETTFGTAPSGSEVEPQENEFTPFRRILGELNLVDGRFTLIPETTE